MGSSPVTATTPPPPTLLATLESFFAREAPAGPGDLLLVAFSGGPDSCALLHGLAALAPRHGWRLHAAHLDHAGDAGSARRAASAAALASSLGVPCTRERLAERPPAGASHEAWARERRYAFLARLADDLAARWVVVAHHRDDQVETVALRLLLGSGIGGLGGIPSRRGRVVRPLLRWRRQELRAALAGSGLVPLDDPTNGDLTMARNRVRHQLLPSLGADAVAALERVGRAAAAATARLHARLAAHLGPALEADPPGLPLDRLRAVPAGLLPWALALLHRRARRPYPPPATAVSELARQLAAARRIGAACGGGWRWVLDGSLLRLQPPAVAPRPFAYTLAVPGRGEIAEAGLALRLSRQPAAAWMRHGSATWVALSLPLAPGDRVVVRSRLPGDRLRPLGRSRPRRLKEVLIDRKVPRAARDRLPLLCVGDQIAWVPGVTVHEPFRLHDGAATAWVAELTPLAAPSSEAGR
ncbi:MAG TPA: tRNA lysidine(34) synthetase TilS [Thermoanaerobaculia bacterium]|nr:tRNA lysidine(34) synthetase TilS [Thermoanaerobaculia bacterium]